MTARSRATRSPNSSSPRSTERAGRVYATASPTMCSRSSADTTRVTYDHPNYREGLNEGRLLCLGFSKVRREDPRAERRSDASTSATPAHEGPATGPRRARVEGARPRLALAWHGECRRCRCDERCRPRPTPRPPRPSTIPRPPSRPAPTPRHLYTYAHWAGPGLQPSSSFHFLYFEKNLIMLILLLGLHGKYM